MADLYGVIHLPSLKSYSSHQLPSIIEYAVSQAILLDELQYDGIIIENFGDSPFAKTQVTGTVLTKLAVICHEVRQEIGGKIGLNILRNASVQAMTVASVLDLDFIRSNVWEGVYITDQGIIEGAAHDVIETKSQFHNDVAVYADILVKHASPLSDFSLIEAATHALGRGQADQIILSGNATGEQVLDSDLEALNSAGIKPIIGSGMTHDNLETYKDRIDGAIVGTAIKEEDVTSPISMDKAKSLKEAWDEHFI